MLTTSCCCHPAAKAPSVTLPYTPAGALPLNGAAGRCNGYVPNSSTLTRFLWTVGVLARNGFIVVIGAPPQPPCTYPVPAACCLTLGSRACCRGPR
jgi:hypothetical protein